MQFFKGKRPEVYIHVAKPRRDKQTGKRFWCLTLIVTMNDDLATSCGDQIAAAYAYLLTLENSAVEVLLDALLPDCAVGFYAIVDDAEPALQLVEVEIGAFRLTRKKNIVELWFSFEKEIDTPGLHGFAKPFMFTRLHAQFTPPADGLFDQRAADGVLQAADRLTEGVRSGEIAQMTIEGAGQKVVIDQAGAGRIHEKAKAAKKKPRDPG